MSSIELNLSAWRRRRTNLGLVGFIDDEDNLSLQPRSAPIRDLSKVHTNLNGNGNGNGHKKEDPLKSPVIYQASDKVPA